MSHEIDKEPTRRARSWLEAQEDWHDITKAEIRSFLAHYDAMAQALRPFAAEMEDDNGEEISHYAFNENETLLVPQLDLTIGDLRRARAILETYASPKEAPAQPDATR